MRQELFDNPKQQFIAIANGQLAILLLFNKLKELHPELDDSLITAVKANASDFMEDKFYLASIKVIYRSDNFYNILVKTFQSGVFSRFFPNEYRSELNLIAGEFTKEDIQKFIIEEAKRLKNEGVEIVDIDSVSELAEISKNKHEKKEVDALLQKHQDGELLDLNKNNFYILINQYSSYATIAFSLRNIDVENDKMKQELKEIHSKALAIGKLINDNKQSLDWLSQRYLTADSNQVKIISKFIYQICHLGDIRTFETLITKLDKNFDKIINLIPDHNDSPNLSSVSNKNIIAIIEKRISKLDGDSKTTESSRWKNILAKINELTIVDKDFPGLSVSASSEARSSTSSARRLGDSSARRIGDSSQNVAKSGPVSSARGGGGRGA